jgi:hypothetical protein
MNARQSLTMVVLLVLVAACGRRDPPPQPVDETIDPKVAAFEAKRLEYEHKLEAMPVAELAREVATDSSQHIEPFNSAAVREVRRRGGDVAKELAASLREPNASSHLGLLALLDVSPEVYRTVDADFRYDVLTDALRTAEYFNAWGVPHLFLTQPAGRAIICEGPAMEKYLYTLLEDERPALVWGGSDVGEQSEAYRYRVKDYAWALIYEARGQPLKDIPSTPDERNKLIAEVLKQPPNGARAKGVVSKTYDCRDDSPTQQKATTAAAR